MGWGIAEAPGVRNLSLSLSLQGRMCVSNPLSMKSFYGILAALHQKAYFSTDLSARRDSALRGYPETNV
jgi:hypothetical protein